MEYVLDCSSGYDVLRIRLRLGFHIGLCIGLGIETRIGVRIRLHIGLSIGLRIEVYVGVCIRLHTSDYE